MEKISNPNHGYVDNTILKEFLIYDFNNPIETIVTNIYSDLVNNYKDYNHL